MSSDTGGDMNPFPTGRVTILFTDIEGSSVINRTLGNRRYHDALHDPHDQRLADALTRHGGQEYQYKGDGIVAVFHDAHKALDYAREVQEHLAREPLRWTDPEGNERTLAVRMGLHTSVEDMATVEETGRYLQTNEINFAARIEALACGGQVIASQTTYTAAGGKDYGAWKDWPNRRLKSFDAPETVYELLYDGKERLEPGTAWVPDWYRGEQNRYIPRPALEAQVLNYFATERRNNHRQRLVTLKAEGGMGKTRLSISCAIQLAGRFPDGIFFVRLAGRTSDVEIVASEIITVMELSTDVANAENLRSYLHDRQALLILDNYESVDSDAVAEFYGGPICQDSEGADFKKHLTAPVGGMTWNSAGVA